MVVLEIAEIGELEIVQFKVCWDWDLEERVMDVVRDASRSGGSRNTVILWIVEILIFYGFRIVGISFFYFFIGILK